MPRDRRAGEGGEEGMGKDFTCSNASVGWAQADGSCRSTEDYPPPNGVNSQRPKTTDDRTGAAIVGHRASLPLLAVIKAHAAQNAAQVVKVSAGTAMAGVVHNRFCHFDMAM